MTVDAIRQQNFMAFEDTGWIELKPISLLFGRNSSGKSAIIRGLLFLKQSLESYREVGPFLFTSHTGIDQGSYRETVHQQDIDRFITFGFRCNLAGTELWDELNDWLARSDQPLIVDEDKKWVEITLTYGWDRDQEIAYHYGIRLEVARPDGEPDDRLSIWGIEILESAIAKEYGEGWWQWSDIFISEKWPPLSLVPKDRGFWPLIENLDLSNINIKISSRVKEHFSFLDKLIKHLEIEVKTFLEKIEYLGPLRPKPERIYIINREESAEWQQEGLRAFFDFLSKKIDTPKLERLDEWLRILNLGYQVNLVEAHKIGSEILAQVKIREQENDRIEMSFKDVGFGTSQVLPILLQCLLAPKGYLIIVEQPELHLHPSAQADVGDLFIERIYKVVKNRKELSGVRFLIETHSEHILLRIRRRIAESSAKKIHEKAREYLLPKDTCAHFVERIGEASSVKNIAIGFSGELDSVPGFVGFFADDMREVAALARARLENDSIW